MRLGALALVLLGLAFPATAEEAALKPPDALTLKLTTAEAMLISQTLGAIPCRTVTELVVCQQAADLLRSLREQAKAQGR